jgi:hypothetical protein
MDGLVYYPEYPCSLVDIAQAARIIGYTCTFYDEELTIRFDNSLSNYPIAVIIDFKALEIEACQLELLNKRFSVPKGHLLIEYHLPILEKVLTLMRHVMVTYKGLVYSEYKADALYDDTELEKIVELRDL